MSSLFAPFLCVCWGDFMISYDGLTGLGEGFTVLQSQRVLTEAFLCGRYMFSLCMLDSLVNLNGL